MANGPHLPDPAALRIVHYPDPMLSRRARPVDSIDDHVRAVAERMLTLMHEAQGIGLAAPQVGLPWRLFVTRGLEEIEGDIDRVFINPKLTVLDGALTVHEEGCLSLPGINADIRRPRAVAIEAVDLEDKPFRLETDDFRARVWQHEFDHLEGILIMQRMSPIDRLATRRAVKELEQAG